MENKAIRDNVCSICNSSKAKYCCPRCNILYCSLSCYTSETHFNCSEAFYKECVKENYDLQDEESKTKMLEILSRQQIQADEVPSGSSDDCLDSDDEQYKDLGERLAGIDLDDAEAVWSKLNEDERQEFEAFLKSGDVAKFVPKWEPWWTFHSHKKVLEISQFNAIKSKCPKIKENIKDILSLTKKYPSECVTYNIINLLTAYGFMARYFNGEFHNYPREGVSCVVSLSLALKINHDFEEFSTAVESVHSEIIQCVWISADEENIKKMREDIHGILKGPHKTENKLYILSAVSDFFDLVESALKQFEEKKMSAFSERFPHATFPPNSLENKERLKQHMKKMEFYMSYVKDCWKT